MCQSYLNLQRYQIIEEKSLIENNIPFITDKQVFLPFIGTMLSEKTMLNPSRVVTYAVSEKNYDKALLMIFHLFYLLQIQMMKELKKQ